MRNSILAVLACLSSSALAVTGALGDAPVTSGNIPGVAYEAVLPDRNTTKLRGKISGVSGSNGTGVVFTINWSGFPAAEMGPFIYHIHDQPVPTNGNCTGTLAHLDPFQRGETPVCDPTQPQTCQVGDLSGKHGNITGSAYNASYLDLYLTTLSGPGAFFGNRSIVIHNQNKTRLTCANFTAVAGGYSGPNATTSSPPAVYTGGANEVAVSAGTIAVTLFGMMAILA